MQCTYRWARYERVVFLFRQCAQGALTITSGPTASAIQDDMAVISWRTSLERISQ